MRNNHKIHKNSYSNLYYNYFNPNASMYNNYNILKRQRSKDSYVDIMNERKDFISYEINRKEMGKINSCLTTSKAKNKLESKFKNRNENNKKSVKGTVNHINNINKINKINNIGSWKKTMENLFELIFFIYKWIKDMMLK